MSMSDPFLPVPPGGPAPDGRETDIDHDVDVFLDDEIDDSDDDAPRESATRPPFRTPVPGDAASEEQLDEDLGLTPPPPPGE